MNEEPHSMDRRAEQLRRAFDQSFEVASHRETTFTEDFLGIRVAEDPYAIRLSEISGLFLDKAITRLPGSASGLVGVAAFRGAIVPVYDLRVLLGYPESGPPRWLALAVAPTPLGLAFDKFEHHLRVPPETIAKQDTEGQRVHVREIVRTGETARPIIHLPSLLNAVTTRARAVGLNKER